MSTPEVKAKYDALVLVVEQMLGRCRACDGTGTEILDPWKAVKDGTQAVHRLCATCGLVRQLLKAQEK